MAVSGIKVSDELVKAIDTLGMEKNRNYAFVAKICDNKVVVVKDMRLTEDDKKHEAFRYMTENFLKDGEACWLFFSFRFNCLEDDRLYEKPLMITWVPDSLKVREKMLTSSTKQALKNKCEKYLDVNWNDRDDIDFNNVIDTFRDAKGKTVCCVFEVPVKGKPGKSKYTHPFGSEYELCPKHRTHSV